MKGSIAVRAALRYLLRHPWLTALSVLGIALGVAVVVSIDSANAGAKRAFDLSAERVTGRATHHIVGPSSIDGELYRKLRVEFGIRPSAPVVEGYVTYRGRAFQLLGIDPFADRGFRPYTADVSALDLGSFLGGAHTVLVSPDLDAVAGDTLHLRIGGRTDIVTVGGLIIPEDETSREATRNLMVADIGTAQELLQMPGRLSRIDLILDGGARRIQAILPDGVQLVSSGARTATLDQMTDAFELNLNALSLLALVVAMFLIYNAMTFSVVQRRTLIGRMRAIGVSRRQIFAGVLLEAGVLGFAGSVIGLILGTWLAQGLVQLVTQTINDLYYVLEVRSAVVDVSVFGKGVFLGTVATIAAAIAPAWEAAASPVGAVLQRSEEERKTGRRLPGLSAAGGAAAVLATVVLLVSGRNLTVSYAGLILLLAAFALLTPAATLVLGRTARRLLGIPFGLIGRMSAQGVVQNLSRTSVAIAALAIAVAAAVGVGTMVQSFRGTVANWLDYTLQADLYVQPPGAGLHLTGATLDDDLPAQLRALPGIRGVSSVRRIDVVINGRQATLAAVEAGPGGAGSTRFTDGNSDEIWRAFRETDAVLVSEPFAYRHALERGDTLELPTDRGAVRVPVAGVFYDYGSDAGLVSMTRERFDASFDAVGHSGISIYAEEDADLSIITQRIRDVVDRRLSIRSNRGLREASLEVFDRTFAITAVLRVLALLVAFGGIVSALMALQIERSKEFAVLRAEGMTPGQVRRLLMLQTGLMGSIAGLLSIPLGIVLAYVLVYVINKRSFGWSLDFEIPPEVLLEAFAVAFVAAIIAGLYPAWKLSRADPAEALRGE